MNLILSLPQYLQSLPELKVPFARVGATVIDAYTDRRPRPRTVLKPAKIRGVDSKGMACSELELGLGESHEGVMFLAPEAPVGTPLSDYLGDQVLDLDLTPDLARCLSIVGVAREVNALTGAPLHVPDMTCEQFEGEAAAEYVHRQVRTVMRIDPDRGLRYSWGYGACPDPLQHREVFRLLPARERLGLELTEAGVLVPELSTAALVIHHPLAKYFFV